MTINSDGIDLSSKLKFNSSNSEIGFTSAINFNNGSSNVLTLDNSGNLTFNNANSDIKFTSAINFNDGTNNIMTINSDGIDLSSNLKFNSSNSEIGFTSAINFNDGTKNIVTINSDGIDLSSNLTFNNNSAQINYQSELMLSKKQNNNLPILSYNINSNSSNYYEKKYLINSIIDASGTSILLCKNILNSQNEQLTFIAKIISRDLDNNSSHFTIEGYSRHTTTNNNEITFVLNTLYSSNVNWTITNINISGLDLQIELQSNQTTQTKWLISIESISI